MARWATSKGLLPLFALGRWDEAVAASVALTAQLDPSDALSRVVLSSVQAQIQLFRGHLDDALELIEWAVPAEGEGDPDFAGGPLLLCAAVRVALGEPATAVDLLNRYERMPDIRHTFIYRNHMPLVVRTAIAAGDLDLARRLVAQVQTPWPSAEHALASAHAALAEASGEYDDAARRYADASAQWESFGVVPETAFARLGQGRSLLAAGRAVEAMVPLEKSRDVFARLGATPWLQLCDHYLARRAARVGDIDL
jgi:ATP/maltotriose-dependent transcriptional regulator MalT